MSDGLPTPEEFEAARERALDAYFARADTSTATRPGEAFRAGFEAALFAFYPSRVILGADVDPAVFEEIVRDRRQVVYVPDPQPAGLVAAQLRALADGIRLRFRPPSDTQHPRDHVTSEALRALADGLEALARDADG